MSSYSKELGLPLMHPDFDTRSTRDWKYPGSRSNINDVLVTRSASTRRFRAQIMLAAVHTKNMTALSVRRSMWQFELGEHSKIRLSGPDAARPHRRHDSTIRRLFWIRRLLFINPAAIVADGVMVTLTPELAGVGAL